MKHDAGDLNRHRAAAGGALAALQRHTGNKRRVTRLFFHRETFGIQAPPARRVSCE